MLDGNGAVKELIDPEKTSELPVADKLDGILCPGFINAHCHLELSHMHGQVQKQTGFTGFAKELLPKRGTFSAGEIASAIEKADEEMFANGIAGVGDISNTADSFLQKTKSKIQYHTFIELLALNPQMAEKVVADGVELMKSAPKPNSLSPHAPYTASNELLEMIGNSSHDEKCPLTMHNQESAGESEFFTRGTGPMREFYAFLGIPIPYFKPTGVNSMRSKLKSLPHSRNLLLVHNTFTSAEDIRWAEFYSKKLYWCFCPNANLYIENVLPSFQVFRDAGVKMIVGTDSLASNDRLSVLDELKVIAKNVPGIPLGELLTWATKNGADALNFSSLGSFEKGKKPGVNLLTKVTNEKLLPETEVKRIL